MFLRTFAKGLLELLVDASSSVQSSLRKVWQFRSPGRIFRRLEDEGEAELLRIEEQEVSAREESRLWWEEKLRQNNIEQDRKDREIARNAIASQRVLNIGGYARTPKDADDFEEVAASFARSAGFVDARRTPKGPDGGVDVVSKDMVGQAKFHPSQKVAPSDIRALSGSRQEFKVKYALFFHFGPGYSIESIRTAERLSVLLFQFVPSRGFVRVR